LYKEIAKKGVKYVVHGALSEEEYVLFHEKLCQSAGLQLCVPLWKKTSDELMDELENYNIRSVITMVDNNKLSREWLGRIYDRTVYNHFNVLNIDPLGECGEFHTTVVDATLFQNPLDYKVLEIIEDIANIELYTKGKVII